MTDQNLPQNDEPQDDNPEGNKPRDAKPKNTRPRTPISMNRILIWVGVSGVGLYALITGIVGTLTKSR
jgi:hypothetical protein